MLELKTKWMTNTLAKASMLNKDYVLCESGARLFIVGYGVLTSSGKNTYNYELKSEDGVLLASGESAYLDKLTTLVKGESPKTKANKSERKSEASVSYEINFVTLQTKYESAKAKFEEFCTKHGIKTQEDAKHKDDDARDAKRKAHQTLRRGELTMLKRLQTLRKWAKETKRIELLQSLSDRMLNL